MNVFRRTYTRPLPDRCKILRRRGGKVAQFLLRGKVQEAKLTASGGRILCNSRHWFVTFTDNLRIEHTLKAFTEEEPTRVLADKIKRLLAYKVVGEEPDIELATWFNSKDRPERIRHELVKTGLLDASAAVFEAIGRSCGSFATRGRGKEVFNARLQEAYEELGRYTETLREGLV